MNAFKRPDRPKCDTYYVRFELKGKSYLRKTPYKNAEQALAYGRAIRAAEEKSDCAELRAALDRAAYRKPVADVTIHQVITAYHRHAPLLRQISDTTIEQNINALHNILRRAGGNRTANDSLSTLNANLIDDFKRDALTAAQDEDDDEHAQRHFRTANSLLRQARSLFTPDLIDAYLEREKFALPSLERFLNKTGFHKVSKTEYHAAPDPLLAKTFAALEPLEQTDPNAYTAIWLTIGFGLRRGEIGHLKPSSFTTTNNRPAVQIRKKTKNGDTIITILCQLDAWQRLAPRININQEHILHGHTTERTEETFRRISIWMRTLGWDTQKTHHEFRAWAGCKIAETHGLLAARDFLRHASVQTTERYYGRYIRQQIPHTPIQIPTVQPPQILPAATSL